MRHLLLSILVVSLVGILMIPNVFAQTLEDEIIEVFGDPYPLSKWVSWEHDPPFSIKYPSTWESCNTEFSGCYDPEWFATINWIRVSYIPDFFIDFPQSDFLSDTVFKRLDFLTGLPEFTCSNDELTNPDTPEFTIAGVSSNYLCSNYKLVKEGIVMTDITKPGSTYYFPLDVFVESGRSIPDRLVYLVHSEFTKEYTDQNYYGGEFVIPVTQINLFHIFGTDIWSVESQIDEIYVDTYYQAVEDSSLSLQIGIPGSNTLTPTIPDWIKNNAGWWASDQISTSAFLQGIQFLIKEGIMIIPDTVIEETSKTQVVPDWVKNNARWWADGLMDDSSFVSGIQYLIKIGIIVVE